MLFPLETWEDGVEFQLNFSNEIKNRIAFESVTLYARFAAVFSIGSGQQSVYVYISIMRLKSSLPYGTRFCKIR